jgi:ribulose-phosphate 3-epimerase
MADRAVKIAPSVLSADFSRLGEQVAEAAAGGADYIHLDIMDGHFVPALTFGPIVVKAVRRWTDIPLDVHMMVSEPHLYIDELAEAGADIVTVHAEAATHLHRVVQQIKDAGLRAGVALSPATPLSAVGEVLPDLDLLLVMSVNPGFGGQPFITASVDKIARARKTLDDANLSTELSVDGGIGPATAGSVAKAGARVLVAGSAVYGNPAGIAAAITEIRSAANTG